MSGVQLVGLDSRTLLTFADDLLSTPSDAWAGRWPRAVALLTRQALERSMDELWAAKSPPMLGATTRAKLLCLRHWIQPEVAGRAAYTWSALSEACHQHAYDLAPTSSELAGWIESVDELQRTIGARLAPRPPLNETS